ncbi:hypothetical protein HYC85_026337 [Camellia sinensis]|uniref:Beta-galactosidase n=1 Tax=Camellia sinensis TaxID=4442 RepID=A0A7J7G701_CAMSI|nr:hypothetical protein HYC85_026337 [Camellia sinensis]
MLLSITLFLWVFVVLLLLLLLQPLFLMMIEPSPLMAREGFSFLVPFTTLEAPLRFFTFLRMFFSHPYNFAGRYDLVRFIKLVQQAGLYVHLRIGPYVCAEWNFGGFPVWLKYVQGISFRTDNEPFKAAMQKFTKKIVDVMKSEKLFQTQGGPIIMSQIENEYGPVEWEIGAPGLGTGVPWIMCKQEDAPDPIIDTCNGFYCENFKPNKSSKPKMWTEAWTGGTMAGQILGEQLLVSSLPLAMILTLRLMNTVHVFNSKSACAAFLANYDTKSPAKVAFQNTQYDLPPWSISILLDCKIEIFNTAKKYQKILAPKVHRMKMTPVNGGVFSWQSSNEQTVSADDSDTIARDGLWDQISLTRDASDYLWYLTNVNIQPGEAFLKNGQSPTLTIMSAGHTLHIFINGQLSGTTYGSLQNPKLTYSGNVKLRAGINKISLLSVAVGLPNVGLHFETWNTGVLGPVTLKGLNEGTRDLTNQKWSYKVGLKGESLKLHTLDGSSSVEWVEGSSLATKRPLTWYKTTFNAPAGNDPLALDTSTMGKGEIWVNGQSIGRHWPGYKARGNCGGCSYAGIFNEKKCRTNCGEASQRWYHVPRSWLKPSGNSLVVFEEWGGDPTGISLVKRIAQ